MLTLMLSLIVGALRIALVGYEQVAADGAAFYHAHQTGIQGTYPDNAQNLDPDVATHQAFGQSQTGTITTGTYMPPNANVSTQYGFDQSGNRHGGASLVQPLQTISTVSHSAPSLLVFGDAGSVLTVTGHRRRAHVPRDRHPRQHRRQRFRHDASFDLANDYFSQGENTPPYFGGFHFMRFCDVPDDAATSWTGCPDDGELSRAGSGGVSRSRQLDAHAQRHRAAQLRRVLGDAVPSERLREADERSGERDPAGHLARPPGSSRRKKRSTARRIRRCARCTAGTPRSKAVFRANNYTPGQFPLTPGASC